MNRTERAVIVWKPQPRQLEFMRRPEPEALYGGAAGGGKSDALLIEALRQVHIPHYRALILRKTYPQLSDLVDKSQMYYRRAFPEAQYNATSHVWVFPSGAKIWFGSMQYTKDRTNYQGKAYDFIGFDELTHFEWEEYSYMMSRNRPTGPGTRVYMRATTNPGGIGHLWVKRLFVDREYREGEKAKDYTFIPATVDDNPQLLEASPEYKQMLDLLPEDVRRAWRYGDWNAMAGTFFPEFRKETHVIAPFVRVPREWKKYRAFDYGLDMFACLWVAVDFEGRAYVYREVQQSGLIVSEAAKLANALTPPEEHIEFTIAPPDMWNRQKDSGRSMAEIFAQYGLGLLKASNNRVQGWMAVKELLKPMKSDTDRPGLLVTENCVGLIRNLPSIQHDEKNPSDCATEPHEITHICDAARYFCVTRVLGAQKTVEKIVDDFDEGEDYDDVMTGGEMTAGYLSYG